VTGLRLDGFCRPSEVLLLRPRPRPRPRDAGAGEEALPSLSRLFPRADLLCGCDYISKVKSKKEKGWYLCTLKEIINLKG